MITKHCSLPTPAQCPHPIVWRDQNWDFFPKLNFPKPKPWLFFRDRIFRNRTWDTHKLAKVSKPKCYTLPHPHQHAFSVGWKFDAAHDVEIFLKKTIFDELLGRNLGVLLLCDSGALLPSWGSFVALTSTQGACGETGCLLGTWTFIFSFTIIIDGSDVIVSTDQNRRHATLSGISALRPRMILDWKEVIVGDSLDKADINEFLD